MAERLSQMAPQVFTESASPPSCAAAAADGTPHA